MTNSRQHANSRHAKALRLAEFLAPFADAGTAALLSGERRRQVERMAGERRYGSDETWAMAIGFLRRWEADRGRAALRWVDDERFLPAAAA